jgi:hypothetical protein
MKLYIALICLILQCTSSATEIVSPGEKFKVDGFEWQSKPLSTGTVKIANAYGNIRARGSDDNRIHVFGIIQKLNPTHESFEIKVDTEGDQTNIKVLFPQQLEIGLGRVDLSIMVPKKVFLDASTTGGLLKLKRFKSAASLTSKNGPIKINTAHPVNAKTDSGEIKAKFSTKNWLNTSRLQTNSGDIHAEYAKDANLFISARSNSGKVTYMGKSDAPESAIIQHNKIGSGGSELLLSSQSGNIWIGTFDMARPIK